MRALSRLLAAVALTVLALTFSATPSESDQCFYCWQQGDCTYCMDYCFGDCIYMCPWGDGRC